MKAMFSIELWKDASPDSRAYAELCLPATDYELLDALDKLRLEGGEEPKWEVLQYHAFPQLAPFLDGGLVELNALARKLSELDERQSAAFEGLLQIEAFVKKEAPHSLRELIDIAYSTDCCHVVEEARNDTQLGKFYVENGFVPETEGFSETQLAMLDYAKIGREQRQAEGGVFTSGVYVTQHSALRKAPEPPPLGVPDHTILLEVSKDANGPPAQLKLPAAPEELEGWRVWRCLDCRVPMLTSMISGEEEITEINILAQKLADLTPKDLIKYKSLLEASDCRSLDEADRLIETLDAYRFSPRISSPIELGKAELRTSLGEAAELLLPHVNLYQYGEALMETQGSVLTEYGLLERRDGQPVQAIKHQCGMEMNGF